MHPELAYRVGPQAQEGASGQMGALPLKVELRGGQCLTALPAIVVGSSVSPRPLIAAT